MSEELDDVLEKEATPIQKDDEVYYSFGPDRESVHAKEFINTSGLAVPVGQEVVIDGQKVRTGYYSNSSLDSYRRCQKYFDYKYIQKLPTHQGLAMIEGSSVHKAVEDILRPKVGNPTGQLGSVEEAIQAFRDTFENRIADERTVLSDEDKAGLGKTVDLNVELIKKFHKELAPVMVPVAVEKMFIVKVPIKGTLGFMPVMGFIDFIEMTFDHGKFIWDFKTGKHPKKAIDIKTNNQLTLYSMAENIPWVGFINLKKGTQGKPGGISDKTGKQLKGKAGILTLIEKVVGEESHKTVTDYERITEDISACVRSINAGFFDRTGRGSYLCNKTYCPFYDKCLG